jgi:hypothetical protein
MIDNPKLTAATVKIRLASGKMTTGIRHKNLTPTPGPGTPSAGPASTPAPSPKSIITEPNWVDDTHLDRDDLGPIYTHGFSLDLESGAIHEWDRHRSENSTRSEEYYGHTFALTFPGALSASSKAELFEEIRAGLETHVAEYESVWDGQNIVNGAPYNEDADDALAAVLARYEYVSEDYQSEVWEARNDEFGDDLHRTATSLTSDSTSAEAEQGDGLDGRIILKDRRTGIKVEIYLTWGEDFDVATSAGIAELAELVAEHDDDD